MEDVLNLLNINSSYEERKKEIEQYLNRPNPNYKILHLTVASTTLTYTQKIFSISPSGMINTPPILNNNDGIVLFGYDENDNKSNNKINDFIFPVNNLEKTKNNNGIDFPNFAIYFDTKEENYYIKDFNTGVGALMKIKKFQLENNTLINVGSNYLVISFEENYLIIKIFNNNQGGDSGSGENYSSKKIKVDKSNNFFITIGRSQKCDVCIDDMMLSKIQSCIEYNPNEDVFYLYDGNSKKESTNGTWVFIINPFKISDGFVFKAEHTLFSCSIIDKK